MSESKVLQQFARAGVDLLEAEDPTLYGLMEAEYRRQNRSLALVASCSPTHPSTLACEGSFTSNVTAEGYPGARFHAGCEYVDKFEQLAIDRTKEAFGAAYANVQPHTASTANQVVMSSLLKPGDTLLGMDLDSGGHLSHGSKVNISGKVFQSYGYGLDTEGFLDYDQAAAMAKEHQPKLIICGTTAYPRMIDWERFRAIADDVGAYLLADITHIAGLVITAEHPNPIDVAHVTTTCTHKQIYGPRGGLIMLGKDKDTKGPDGKATLERLMQRGVFPLIQGAPIVNNIVAKARAIGRTLTPEFRTLAKRIVSLSRALAAALMEKDARIMSGGSDNHIVVMDALTSFGLTGVVAEEALEDCHIIVNRNRIAGDTKPPKVGSGVRFGTNTLAVRELADADAAACADLISDVLRATELISDKEYKLDKDQRDAFRERVGALCARFPIPGYPLPS